MTTKTEPTVAPADRTWHCKACNGTTTQPAMVTWVAHKCSPNARPVPLTLTDS